MHMVHYKKTGKVVTYRFIIVRTNML